MNDIDKILIKKSKKGDLDSFEQLISKYQKTAYNIALKMLKNPDDAMDISQEAFIKVFKSIKNFNGKSSFTTWLYRIVVNTCLDFIKKNKEKTVSLDNPITTEEGSIKREVEDTSNTPEQILDKKLTKTFVHSSIDELKDKYKTIIILRDIEGFSYEEIENILDIPLGTVKSRIKRAREKLKVIILKKMKQNNNNIV